jgi:NADH-quinone oxidoreductase subunit N
VNPEAAAHLTDVFRLAVPEMILGLGASVLFLGATFRASRNVWAAVALITLASAGTALFAVPVNVATGGSADFVPLVLDPLAFFTKCVALAGGIVLVLLSWNEVPDRQAAEYHACLLLILAGLCLAGAASELVTLFLALELISIPTYVLLYLPRYDNAAQEAALKYFLLSIFSSALLLFGFSYFYGLAGTTSVGALLETFAGAGREGLPAIAYIALILVLAGLGFRITAVPFHFYAPDVYQGTPAIAAALLAFIPKVAGFVVLIRLLGFLWMNDTGLVLGAQLPMIFYILAVVTMTLGNILGLLQDNVKRLLAYSSVAHAGYMLIGLTVAPELQSERLTSGMDIAGGVDAVLFYLVAYGAMTIGAFAVLAYLDTPEQPVETIDDLAGLSGTHPGIALLMAIFLFSLIGIPLTAGFAGKLLLFLGALSVPPREHAWLFRGLALVGALNAAVGAWYYLRILASMYLRGTVRPLPAVRSWPGLASLWACAAVTLVLGIYPALLVNFTRDAAVPEQQARRAAPAEAVVRGP